MPFKSKDQSAACFASGGFDGKVDCEEWADKTDYKRLPKKKKKKKKFKEWMQEKHPDFTTSQSYLDVCNSRVTPASEPQQS